MHNTVIELLDKVRQFWTTTVSLNAFIDWPDDLTARNPAPNLAPVADKIVAWRPSKNNKTSPLVHAVQQAALHVNWQFIYTEDQVGRHFLDNYAYFELIGPTGHFWSDQCCAFIGYWGPGLFYPAHHHAYEELYFVLAGHALFDSESDNPATLGPAAHRSHASQQPHTMTTTDSAMLTLVLWRGLEFNRPVTTC